MIYMKSSVICVLTNRASGSSPMTGSVTLAMSRLSMRRYLDTLKGVAAYYGYEPSSIDELLDVGFSTDEIEELLYERMIY